MPAGVVIAAAITAGAGTATAVHGSRVASRAGRQAAKYTEAAASQATRTERDADQRNREEFDRVQEEDRRRWDAEQAQILEDRRLAQEDRIRAQALEAEDRRIAEQERARAEEDRQRNIAVWNEREARMAPYRQAGAGALADMRRLSGMAGEPAASGPRPMPAGWTPESEPPPVSSSSSPSAALPPASNRSSSLTDYTSSLPITRDQGLARELDPDMGEYGDEVPSGSLADLRKPEDLSYALDNPSTVSPEAYRRLVLSQGEGEERLPLSAMRYPSAWRDRGTRPRRGEMARRA